MGIARIFICLSIEVALLNSVACQNDTSPVMMTESTLSSTSLPAPVFIVTDSSDQAPPMTSTTWSTPITATPDIITSDVALATRSTEAEETANGRNVEAAAAVEEDFNTGSARASTQAMRPTWASPPVVYPPSVSKYQTGVRNLQKRRHKFGERTTSPMKLVTSLPKNTAADLVTPFRRTVMSTVHSPIDHEEDEFVGIQPPYGIQPGIPYDIPDFLPRPLHEDYEDYELFAPDHGPHHHQHPFRQHVFRRPAKQLRLSAAAHHHHHPHYNHLMRSVQLRVRGNDSYDDTDTRGGHGIMYEDTDAMIVGRGSFREVKAPSSAIRPSTLVLDNELVRGSMPDWGANFPHMLHPSSPPRSPSAGFLPSAGHFGNVVETPPPPPTSFIRHPPIVWRIPPSVNGVGTYHPFLIRPASTVNEADPIYQRFWSANE